MRRLLLVSSLLVMVAAPCFAQHGGAPAGGMHAAPAAHVAAPVARPVGPSHLASHPVPARATTHTSINRPPVHTYPSRPTGTATFNTYSNYGSQPYDFGSNVPGLGFDYTHYAAVHPNSRHYYGGSAYPFVGGSIFVPTPYYYGGDYAEPEEQPVESGQVQGPEQQGEITAEAPTEPPPAAPRSRAYSVAAPPMTEYTFVRRDGSLFFAVAYSWTNGTLQYVTQDGLRKIVPLSALDLDATSQFNEQRGVTFHLPA